MSSFKFVEIFKTNLIEQTPLKIIQDPVKIEFFKGSRTYKVPFQQSTVVRKGNDSLISRNITLELDSRSSYIVLTAKIEEDNPNTARKICEDNIDRIITSLSLIYKPEIFSDLVYRGWLLEKTGIMEAWVKITEPVILEEKALSTELSKIMKKQSEDIETLNRFSLMSRFYSKALSEKPSEEKFILLWTILEIFPMKDTTDIKPISEYLTLVTGKQPDMIKKKLDIGHLYGSRCNLVHHGKFDIELKDMGEVFTRLENIIHEILRHMIGLNYSGSLDKLLS